MPLPTGPSGGGLPQRPGNGLPPRQPNGQPPTGQRPPAAPPQNFEQPQLPPVAQPPVTNERLSQYDFDAQRVERPAQRQPEPQAQRPPQQEQYNPQQQYTPAPQGQYNDWDNEPAPQYDPYEEEQRAEALARKERETAARFDRSMEQRQPAGKIKNNVLAPQSGELDEKGQNVFIDKKEKKLKAFGGKKSAIKVSDLDRRKNLRQNARIVQVLVIGLVLVTLGFAGKNAFFPPASLSPTDVQSIVYQTTGSTAFPIEKGRYFAETFMESYLEYNPNDPASSAVMQYYNNGSLAVGGVAPGLDVRSGWNQTVVNGPFTYQSQAASPSSAIYTVGALVNVSNNGATTTTNTVPTPTPTETPVADGEEPTEEGSGTSEGEVENTNTSTPSGSDSDTSARTVAETADGKLMWQYYTINVYYDAESDTFSIASYPTIVPNPSVGKVNDLPSSVAIGTGKAVTADTLESITPTVYGFLEAYRVSSSTDYSKLTPFLGTDPDSALLKGLDSVYDFKGGSADDKSVVMAAFLTETSEIKVQLTITWTQTVGGQTAEILSQYVITVVPQAGGYDVTRFVPLAYIPAS